MASQGAPLSLPLEHIITASPTRRRRILSVARHHPTLVIGALILLFFIITIPFAPLIAPYSPDAIDALAPLAGPSPSHWLGTDNLGRDVLTRVLFAGRIDLSVAFGAVFFAMLVGTPLGLIAGYAGGWLDTVISRCLDTLLAFPGLLFAILVVAALGASLPTLMLTIGVIYIPYFGRLARAATLSLREREFVLASVIAGSSTPRLLVTVLFPNLLTPLLVQASFALGVSLLIEAGLSFLGLGIPPPTPMWGQMLQDSELYVAQAPWLMLAPGACIFIVVVSFNVIGEGLRDLLDPQLRASA
jgi:peptide/nickel transport system permease protein